MIWGVCLHVNKSLYLHELEGVGVFFCVCVGIVYICVCTFCFLYIANILLRVQETIETIVTSAKM